MARSSPRQVKMSRVGNRKAILLLGNLPSVAMWRCTRWCITTCVDLDRVRPRHAWGRCARAARTVLGLVSVQAMVLAGGCSVPDGAPEPIVSHSGSFGASSPGGLAVEETGLKEWAVVAQALGRDGVLLADSVYRLSLSRNDLRVSSARGALVLPGMALEGYVAFARYVDGATLMIGNLIVTEAELPKITSALQANGIDRTATHHHVLGQDPRLWWMHFSAVDADARAMASGLKAVVDALGIPNPPSPLAASPSPDSVMAATDRLLGATGREDAGVLTYRFPRAETVTWMGRILPPTMGPATTINFQPTALDETVVSGDFALNPEEVANVTYALREGGFNLVKPHTAPSLHRSEPGSRALLGPRRPAARYRLAAGCY